MFEEADFDGIDFVTDGTPPEAPPIGGIPWGWHQPHYDRRGRARKDEDILLF